MVLYKLSALIGQYLTMTFQRIENIERAARSRALTHKREQHQHNHNSEREPTRESQYTPSVVALVSIYSFCLAQQHSTGSGTHTLAGSQSRDTHEDNSES